MDAQRAIAEIEKLIERGESLRPDPDHPDFSQWRTTTINRLQQLLPKSTVPTSISLLRFKPSQAEQFNALTNGGPGVGGVGRFRDDMEHAIALMRSAIEEFEFDPFGEIQKDEDVAKANINHGNIAKMMAEIQLAFDEHPIRVPVVADDSISAAGGGTTINNYGPVIHGDASGAQLAWGNENVNQAQNRIDQIAPGFELIAQAIAKTLEGLPGAGLSEGDLGDAEAAGREALEEATKSSPDTSKVRRLVATLKGYLAPIALATQTGAGKAVEDWARSAIEQLSKAL